MYHYPFGTRESPVVAPYDSLTKLCNVGERSLATERWAKISLTHIRSIDIHSKCPVGNILVISEGTGSICKSPTAPEFFHSTVDVLGLCKAVQINKHTFGAQTQRVV